MAVDRRDSQPPRGRSIPGRVINAVVGSVVSPVVDNVDIDEVVDRLDVDHLLARVDIDELVGRIDFDAVLDRIDLDDLLDRIDPDRLLDRVEVNHLLDRIDPDRLLDRVDPNRLLDRVDPNRLLDRVDPDRLLDRVDPDRLLDRVDPGRLLDRVDPDRLLDRVDPNRLLDRVDAQALVNRIDLNDLVERVDIDRVMARVDVDAVIERVDVNRIVERTELGAVIARSTTGVFTQLLDVARTQVVTVDQVVQGTAARLLRRPERSVPATPFDPADTPAVRRLTPRKRAIALQGHYAGSVSRFLAFVLDQFISGVLFGLGFALTSAAVEVVLGRTLDLSDQRLLMTAAFLFWDFLYLAVPLAASGRTLGKAVAGLLVVRADGTDIRPRDAVVRTLCFPLSFLLFGVGFLIGLVRADRRQLHDLLAGTSVLYAWDAQTAELRATDPVRPKPATPPAAPEA